MYRTLIIATVLVLALIAASCSSDGGASDIETTSAIAVINSDLLGDGNYTGSGTYTVIEAQKAYSASEDATAVAGQGVGARRGRPVPVLVCQWSRAG